MSQNSIRRNAWTLEKLEGLYLSPTNHCNLRCFMCPNKRLIAPRGFLDWELFQRLVDELNLLCGNPGASFRELHFYNEGEPFMHTRYLEMLRYIDQTLHGIRVFISTNGTLLDDAIIDQLLEFRRNHYYLVFSTDASNRKLYDRIRIGGNFEKVQHSIRYILKRKHKENIRNPYVILQFIIMPENEHDRHNFYWQWEPLLGPIKKASDYEWWPGLIDFNRAHVFWKEFTVEWSTLQVELPYNETFVPRQQTCLYPQHSPSPGRICAWPWRQTTISWNGEVGLCCWHWESYGLLGHVRQQSLRQAFESVKAQEFRRRFWQGESQYLPICGTCDRRDWWHNPWLERELEATDSTISSHPVKLSKLG